MPPARSLLLITVDCFRADHAGFLGYDRATTPFLDSLARQSLIFSNAIVAGAPTYFSFPSVMASRHPLGLGRDVVGLAPEEPTIASALHDAGYATGAFLAANPYLSPRFGYDAGFDVFKDFLDTESGPLPPESNGGTKVRARNRWNQRLARLSHALGPVGSLYDELYFRYGQRVGSSQPLSLDQLRRFPAADAIVDHAQDWLRGIAGQPFFLWLHFMDPHSPYYPRQESLALMGQESLNASRARYLNSYWNRGDLGAARLRRHREEIVALYDAGIRSVDSQVARLVDELKDMGVWEDCVMALTADHGEEFLDHGGRYHPPSNLSEELVRVPLLIRWPAADQTVPNETVAAPFSLLHLAPTLLDMTGVSIPASFKGRSHAALLRAGETWEGDAVIESVAACNNPFIRENRLRPRLLAVREARYKMVIDFSGSKERLYDLNADPRELSPLPDDAEKIVRRRMLERARRHLNDSLSERDSESRMAARLRDIRLECTDSGVRTAV